MDRNWWPTSFRNARPTSSESAAELFQIGLEILQHNAKWNALSTDGLTSEQHDALWQWFEDRHVALSERWGPLRPTTLAGLAMMMRVDLMNSGVCSWLPEAMLRPYGPTRDELEDLSGEAYVTWVGIDHLERIAGLRETPAPQAGA